MKRKIKIESLVLDYKNPRLPNSMDSEISIIEYMILQQQSMALLEDIAKNWLSPIEDIAVCKDGSEYIVLEGNRRVSALKLLKNPDLLPLYSQRIKDILKEHNTKILDVECEVFDKREDARKWLERKHSGQQNGIGTKHWSAEQKTRFEGGRSNNNTLAVSIIDFAKKNDIKEAEIEGILTTVTRFLANPAFRNSIGLRSNTKDLAIVIDIPKEDFILVLEKFIFDVADKNNKAVSSRSNKNDYIKYGNYLYNTYLKEVERVDSYTLNKLEQDVNVDDYEKNDTEAAVDIEAHQNSNDSSDANINGQDALKQKEKLNTSIRQRSSKNPNDRKYIFTNDFYCKTSHQILVTIFHELKKIDVNEFPMSCAIVTRLFMEYILKFYLSSINGKDTSRAKLDYAILEIYKYLNSEENMEKLNQIQRASLKSLKFLQENKSSALSPASLGMNAHAGAYPKASELKIDWMNIEPIIQYILNEIK
ncbi:hypothetical protein AB8P72_09030 [Psychrobacter sp. CLB018]|uniref:hypothetical protein n=1 Tax=Psychrobacter sp. CLB018 TaxID=3240930 RepID=UPI0035110E03